MLTVARVAKGDSRQWRVRRYDASRVSLAVSLQPDEQLGVGSQSWLAFTDAFPMTHTRVWWASSLAAPQVLPGRVALATHSTLWIARPTRGVVCVDRNHEAIPAVTPPESHATHGQMHESGFWRDGWYVVYASAIVLYDAGLTEAATIDIRASPGRFGTSPDGQWIHHERMDQSVWMHRVLHAGAADRRLGCRR